MECADSSALFCGVRRLVGAFRFLVEACQKKSGDKSPHSKPAPFGVRRQSAAAKALWILF